MLDLSISIVSHRQIQLVQLLLADILQYCSSISIEVILTVNLEEPLPFTTNDYMFPLRIIHNNIPKGFGENHNAAFRLAKGDFFCVLNPDIRFSSNPFSALIAQAREANIGLVAPLVLSNVGIKEDSARHFPTPFEIVKKAFGGKSAIYKDSTKPISNPDWVAGMFMLFPKSIFQEIGGFDERFFLYYEDVDLCARLALANYKVIFCSTVSVVHDARRNSRKSLRYMRFHIASMLRFFSSSVYRQLRRRAN